MSGKVHYQQCFYKPFAVLIYFGTSKPVSLDDYFGDFTTEVNRLQANGVTIMEQRFNVRIHWFICDTPARAFIKGTKGHTGFYACERCEIRGFKEDRVPQFSRIHCPERTDESFRRRSQQRHHNPKSPFLQVGNDLS
ncbi:uncharacterized protein LOC117170728 [Belonocnema kinseyi]|uniref:uncharacterized protein LOC117170728 n=1 Tax=Belonocnema kinseyi TaxID=2817044 RepID=UPI00143D264E|nr:uncharacterized protein LOC117170728 [Belonocnema kinseyi]